MDKQGKIKLFIFNLLFLLILAIGAYAIVTISIDITQPAEAYVSKNRTVDFDFRCTGNNSAFNASILGDFNSSSWGIQGTNTTTGNNTLTRISIPIADTLSITANNWNWGILCNATTTYDLNYSANRSLFQDATAPSISSLNNPTDGSSQTDTTVTFGATVRDNNPDVMYLYNNENGTFARREGVSYENNTAKNFTARVMSRDGNITWWVEGWDDGGKGANSTSNRTVVVDSTAPTINLTYYKGGVNRQMDNGSWVTLKNITIGAIVYDNLGVTQISGHAASCVLWTNIAYGNTTQSRNETVTYTNNTAFNFTRWWNLAETTTQRNYTAFVNCNDSIGNNAWSNNISFGIDSIQPSIPTLRDPQANITSTNKTHAPKWTTVTEAGSFGSYYILFDNDSNFASPAVNDSITTRTTNTTKITNNLSYDTTYYWRVDVVDAAGNYNSSANTNKSITYATDSTCANLSTGWNLCGIVRDTDNVANKSLAYLAYEIGADFVSIFNSTHQFETHTRGSTTNAYLNVTRGEVLFVYVSSPTLWGGDPDGFGGRVWSVANATLTNIELINTTVGWNPVSIMNRTGGITPTILNNTLAAGNWTNGTLTMDNLAQFISCYNNSASSGNKFMPYRYDWTINENTRWDFGEACWVWINTTKVYLNRSAGSPRGGI